MEQFEKERVCIIADGAAIGLEMDRLFKYAMKKRNVHLYFPESFEWLLLQSGLIQSKELQAILERPENYIDGKEYFSWERFFTNLLIEETKDSQIGFSIKTVKDSCENFAVID